MDEKAPDKLPGGESHGLVSLSWGDPVVFPLEGDAALIVGDEAAVGEGDAVGVAGEVVEDGAWA